MDGVDLLEAIAKRRSYKRHDGLWDMEKTAVAFLTDYRSGAIGRVSLETPTSREAMIKVCGSSMIQDIVTITPKIAPHTSEPDLTL